MASAILCSPPTRSRLQQGIHPGAERLARSATNSRLRNEGNRLVTKGGNIVDNEQTSEPWTKRVNVAQVDGEQFYVSLGINPESGEGWLQLGGGQWECEPVVLTTRNMAEDLAYEIHQFARRLP